MKVYPFVRHDLMGRHIEAIKHTKYMAYLATVELKRKRDRCLWNGASGVFEWHFGWQWSLTGM